MSDLSAVQMSQGVQDQLSKEFSSGSLLVAHWFQLVRCALQVAPSMLYEECFQLDVSRLVRRTLSLAHADGCS